MNDSQSSPGTAGLPDFDSLVLRPATNLDAPAVQALISRVLASYGIIPDLQRTDGDLLDIEGQYAGTGGAFFVLLDGDAVVGTVALRPGAGTTWELCRMYLAAGFRGRGLGRRLLAHALSEMQARGGSEVVLKTASVLKEAISLYRSAGFCPDCQAKAEGNCNLVLRRRLM